jgi:hypothetical protein
MATPPKLKTLRPEDYDFNGDAAEWGPKLLAVLSTFCGDVTAALSGALTIPENVRGEDREVTFATTATTPAIDAAPFPVTISPQSVKYPKAVTMLNPVVSDGAVPAAAAQVVFRLGSDGSVIIRFVTGIEVSKTYKMRIRLE